MGISKPKGYWTFDRCLELALKHKTRDKLFHNERGADWKMREKGWTEAIWAQVPNNGRLFYSTKNSGVKIGDKLGKVTILDFLDYVESKDGHKRGYWICTCDCGDICIKQTSQLSRKNKRQVSACSKGCKQLLPDGEAHFNSLYNHDYKKRAIKQGLEFRLTKKYFKMLNKMNCYYCGSPPINRLNKKYNSGISEYIYNGVDRVDNTKGYTIDNVVACCNICNLSKKDYGLKEWYSFIVKTFNELSIKDKTFINLINDHKTITSKTKKL